MSLEYGQFIDRVLNDVPHLRKMTFLRLAVKNDEAVEEVDLSKKYFNLQVKGILGKGSKRVLSSEKTKYLLNRKTGDCFTSLTEFLFLPQQIGEEHLTVHAICRELLGMAFTE